MPMLAIAKSALPRLDNVNGSKLFSPTATVPKLKAVGSNAAAGAAALRSILATKEFPVVEGPPITCKLPEPVM